MKIRLIRLFSSTTKSCADWVDVIDWHAAFKIVLKPWKFFFSFSVPHRIKAKLLCLNSIINFTFQPDWNLPHVEVKITGRETFYVQNKGNVFFFFKDLLKLMPFLAARNSTHKRWEGPRLVPDKVASSSPPDFRETQMTLWILTALVKPPLLGHSAIIISFIWRLSCGAAFQIKMQTQCWA